MITSMTSTARRWSGTPRPLAADKRTMIQAYLDWHRATVLYKCAGPTGEQLAEQTGPPSGMSLLGLVRHVAALDAGASSLSTHCPAGQEFTEANTYLDKDAWRNCRACHAEQERARREANRDKQPRFCQNCGTLLGAARIRGTRYCTKSCAARARRAAQKRQPGLAA